MATGQQPKHCNDSEKREEAEGDGNEINCEQKMNTGISTGQQKEALKTKANNLNCGNQECSKRTRQSNSFDLFPAAFVCVRELFTC